MATREETVLASAGWHASPALGFALGVGAVVGGTLSTPDGVAHHVSPGPAASLSTSWLALYESRVRPFVLLGASLAVSRVTTTGGAGLLAGDLRLTAMTGKTFFDTVTPYVVGRVFGGPVFWHELSPIGTDAHHYAVGAGLMLRLPAGLDLFVEGIPLGERSASAGAGFSF